MPASIRRKAVAAGALLALAAPSFAGEDRGAAMLKALRDRDAGAAWEATGDLVPPEPPVRPVVEPLFSPAPPTADMSADGPTWRPSRAASGRNSVLPYPEPLRIAQEEPNEGAAPPSGDDPFDPTPDPAEGEPGTDVNVDPEPAPIARSPGELRKIQDILPYFDYEPDPDVDDPCLYQCPRPDGLPCKEYAAGENVPPCPEEVGLGEDPFAPPSIPPSVFAWKASNLHYNPLYFEDPKLERYGHTYGDCVQPFVSLGRFGVQLVGLPYQMALDPPHKCVYPLGYYRPGEPAPKLFYQIPLNARAAAVTAGFYSGLGVILP